MDWDSVRDVLQRVDVRLFSFGGTAFTLSSLLKLALALVLLVGVAARLRHWMVVRVLLRFQMDLGTRQAIGSIVRYVVLIVGVLVILQNAGINLTTFNVVAGALGVGVGFGLQNVFSNFISGLIVMFERPIKVGDRIEVAGVEGVVHEIGARRTTVVTNDNVAILLPNQRFITDNVVNLVYLERAVRLRVPVNVVAGTDVDLVRSLLLEAAASNDRVLLEPPPSVLLLSLGGGALGFELVVWYQPAGCTRQQLQSELNYAISHKLKMHEVRNG
ncbi:mechanosensitive ion channel [Schlegelella sp. S2-27]|uniref:Mechanosensitive ion channel n=1 Tax=Caldimonas mangrovi TaxID=2944811 RepID=A0ABT0YY01_9BURK|nr:mechanosensitive ion channel domain-containing protein [Caldimonas mangrovi]MCM5682713.1 mechanosensitive ion channel [Caldimonas mangrovi]